jgi:parallel beta-helix repeat protein
MLRKTIVLGIMFVLVTVVFSLIPDEAGGYTTRSPILIDGNSDFTAANGVVSGTGTASDPYIIEDWIIDASGSGSGIHIKNTDKSFVILDCYVKNSGSTLWDSGILLENVDHGQVNRNTATENRYGITLNNCYSCAVVLNNCEDNDVDGIFTYLTSYCVLDRNDCSYNPYYGARIQYSDHMTLKENHFHYNLLGMTLVWSEYCTVGENRMNNNDNIGIVLKDADYNEVYENAIEYNQMEGARVYDDSTNNNIHHNIIKNHTGHGLRLDDTGTTTTNNYVHNNTFLYNGHYTHYTAGLYLYEAATSNMLVENNVFVGNNNGIGLRWNTGITIRGNTIRDSNRAGIDYGPGAGPNTFYHNNFVSNYNDVAGNTLADTYDNGYPSGGNYWDTYTGSDLYKGPAQDVLGSDGIGDTPKSLPGGGADNYPLMEPWSMELEPDEAIEELIDDVEDLELPDGLENSLESKLDNALDSLENG